MLIKRKTLNIHINSILYNNSLVDGPGLRSVVFLQGCDLRCEGCQNQALWELNEGTERDIDELVGELESKMINKRLTISGGEPLLQINELIYFIDKLHAKGFDLALYTGHSKDEIPSEILQKLNYLKTGQFIRNQKTSTTPYVGSKNQIFESLNSAATIF